MAITGDPARLGPARHARPADAAPTEIAPTAPTEPGVAPTTVGPVAPTGVAALSVEPQPVTTRSRRVWPAIAAITVLVLLLALSVRGPGNGGDPATSRSVTPVPAGSDPAQTARNLATWLRDHAARP